MSDETPNQDPDHSRSAPIAPRSSRSFFRVRKDEPVPDLTDVGVQEGPEWTAEEADRQIRLFLDRLHGGRDVVDTDQPDPVAFAVENDLLLHFGPREEEAFGRLARRFPAETLDTWSTLLHGGDRAEAFGPRTKEEREDEEQVSADLKAAAQRRAMTIGGLVVVVVGVLVAARLLLGGDSSPSGEAALRFDLIEEDGGVSVAGSGPVVEPALATSFGTVVAVRSGDADEATRIELDPPASVLPVPAGSLYAALFEFGGTGAVAVAGPTGWAADVCLGLSVTSSDLRPLTVRTVNNRADCPDDVGPAAPVRCEGDALVIVELTVPQGEVELSEGGSTFAELVRLSVTSSPDGYDRVDVRGEIGVGEAVGATIPSFGGSSGDELTVDFSAAGMSVDATPTCTLR